MNLSTSFPWQLYLFSLVNVAGGIFGCFSTYACHLVFGKCADIDVTMMRCFATCMMNVGVLFGVLTYINHRRQDEMVVAPKIKRLAMIATQCILATFVGVITVGPRHLGGNEKGWCHLADMITMAVLFIIMWTAIADDKDVAGCSNLLFSGYGVNTKTLLSIMLVLGIVEFFAQTDFMSYHYFGGNSQDSSEIAKALWNFSTIFVLEFVLILFFTIGYGDYMDQEMTVITMVVMGIISGFAMSFGLTGVGHFMEYIIMMVVFVVLAIGAIVGGRRPELRNSDGYTEVPSA